MKKWYSKYIDFSARWYRLIIILLLAFMTCPMSKYHPSMISTACDLVEKL